MALENFPTREAAKDMLSMVSPIYDESYVGKWIFEIMGMPLGKARDIVNDLQNQLNPETATWTLPYWEESYGIVTNESLSIEERRSAILRKRNYKAPMNPATIELLINDMCKRDVKLIENIAPHTFRIEIADGDSVIDLNEIIEKLCSIKQSQKSFIIGVEQRTDIVLRTNVKQYVTVCFTIDYESLEV